MDNPLDSNLTQEVKTALQNNDQALAVEKVQEYLEKEKNITLNIAITGESGSGKSTFVNAFRGMNDDDEGAAPTGCVETTRKETPYPHPNYSNVTVWDLPGVGTTNFPADKYLKHVGFEKFDFFIIISESRFTENDVKLAQEIKKMGKKFYFVRSKTDNDMRSEGRKKNFNEEDTLKKIRENCKEGLLKLGVEAPQVFLVSSFELNSYDFHLLEETLERELPEHKRNALLLAMPNISLEIIKKKKEAFQAKIKYYSILSSAVAGVPLPGLSTAVDTALMVGVVTQYVVGFGLDRPSLQRLSNSSGVPLKELFAVIMSPLALEGLSSGIVMKPFLQSAAALLAAEEGARLIPLIGIPISMSLSYKITYRGLNTFLSMLADDAQRVFEKALHVNTSG